MEGRYIKFDLEGSRLCVYELDTSGLVYGVVESSL